MTRVKVCQRRRPERGGGLLHVRVELLEHRLHGAHHEGQPDEGERHHHAERA